MWNTVSYRVITWIVDAENSFLEIIRILKLQFIFFFIISLITIRYNLIIIIIKIELYLFIYSLMKFLCNTHNFSISIINLFSLYSIESNNK